MMKTNEVSPDLNRRDFLTGASVATLLSALGAVELKAQDKPAPATGEAPKKPVGPPVNCAVIGCGMWGREILKTLGRLPNAPVVAICDTYPAYLRRSKESAPNAQAYEDYHLLLADKKVQGVIVATPSHQHKQVVLDALKAGKHVYCEAPLASTIEDARAIAQAAKASPKLYFQSGLQMRSDSQRRFLIDFIRSGAIGKSLKMRAQWHKKESWRRVSPNPDREKEINWRLDKAVSTGLMGEIGIHQIDVASWLLNLRPISVTGFGGLLSWKDGRDVPDTAQVIVQYPGGVTCSYECTLANSFDSNFEILYGTDSAVMMRQEKAWMFKEVDAPLLGWEVYARKDEFYKETGIALVANATKLASLQGDKPGDESAPVNASLVSSLHAFVTNANTLGAAVEDFVSNLGDNPSALKQYLADIVKHNVPAAGYQEGFDATVTAIQANEAVVKGQRIDLLKELFEI